MTGCVEAFHDSIDIRGYTAAVKARKFLLLRGVKMVKFRDLTTHCTRSILVTKAESSETLLRSCKGVRRNENAIRYARGYWF